MGKIPPRRDVRVLHLLNSATGGAARSSLELLRRLDTEHGFGPQSIVCHAMGTAEDRQELHDAVEGRILFCDLFWWNRKTGMAAWKRPIAALLQGVRTGWGIGSARKVLEFAVARGSTLIHSNSFTIDDGCRVSRWLGAPHVWHLRELIGRDAPFVFPIEGPALGRYVAGSCDAVIANSRASALGLAPFVPPGRLSMIPNGIDVTRFSPRRRRGPGERGPLVVGMVANLTSRMKNHELFLRASALVPGDVELRIHGYERSDPSRRDAYVDDLRSLASQPGLRHRVRFMGYVPDPAAIMAELDVLVHPCSVESFGRVVLEAMAAGLPVVAARGGGVLDLVVDTVTGFLVDPEEPSDMARRIADLVGSPLLRETLGVAGRRRAVEEFSLSATTGKVAAVYEEVWSRRGAAGPGVEGSPS